MCRCATSRIDAYEALVCSERTSQGLSNRGIVGLVVVDQSENRSVASEF